MELAKGNELCKVIEKFAELEWKKFQSRIVEVVLKDGRIYCKDNSSLPPFTSVRFKKETRDIIFDLKWAVENYRGGVGWSINSFHRISSSGVNWVIRPEFVDRIIREEVGAKAIDSQEYMSEHYPNFALGAYADLLSLAAYVDRVLGGKYV